LARGQSKPPLLHHQLTSHDSKSSHGSADARAELDRMAETVQRSLEDGQQWSPWDRALSGAAYFGAREDDRRAA